jgi:protein BCP1
MDMLNVDFEWFDPQPAVDFHGLKILLRQLFDTDAQLFDLSALTDLILAQPLLGSTVKVDGNESDPYAFLSVLNLQEHKVRRPFRAFDRNVDKQLNVLGYRRNL